MANQNFTFSGEGYYVSVNTSNTNGYKQETVMKFDQYHMYGIDYMG
jgi:hypothetical protein